MPTLNPDLLYVLAGEPSGDLHAANLVRELKCLRPNLELRAMGGDLLAAQGASLVKHIRETSFMGFVEVVRNLRAIRRMFREVKADILEKRPAAVLLVDYPGFNLRMAKWLKRLRAEQGLDIQVLYYISPQVWAWKSGRVAEIRKYVDRMVTILPFEQAWYAERGVLVEFAGHPLLDAIMPVLPAPNTLREDLGLDARPVVALLPGSRKKEIERKLPIMLAAAQQLAGHQMVVAGAPNQPADVYARWLDGTSAVLAQNRTYDLLRIAHCAAVTSGTATLETALFRVPEVVCYRGDWLSYQIAKRVVMGRIRFISLVNLILDYEAVRELIQGNLTVENLASELSRISTPGPCRDTMLAGYEALWQALGSAGASRKAAEVVNRYLPDAECAVRLKTA